MDTGGLAQMTFNNFSAGSFTPSNGYASRGKGSNLKRLSVALPPKVNSINEDGVDNGPLARTTSRSHLLAGLRTAPKSPVSAPYSQQQHHYGTQNNAQWANAGYDHYNQGMPQSAMSHATAAASGYPTNQYVRSAGQQTYALPEQVLAPPSFYEETDDMDPNVLEQLQLTGMFLAQRQQQLQQQLANITAAANQFQGGNLNVLQQQNLQYQLQLQQQMQQQQLMQTAVEVPGQPGVYAAYNPPTSQYQFFTQNDILQQAQQQQVQQQQHQRQNRSRSPLARSGTMPNLSMSSLSSMYDSPKPVFRAEVSPPPVDTPMQTKPRSITPPTKKSPSPAAALEPVEPLPPPSANAFRRGHHKKVSSLSVKVDNGSAEGPKTSSAAIFGSARASVPAGPLTGGFGPGAARSGEHPVRQPCGPPPLDELIALPTAHHEGSKNFAARRRRRALDGLMRASSVRRTASHNSAGSPTSELSLQSSEDDEPGFYRKQSPIGSERSGKRGSQSSIEGSAPGSTVQTPATEDSNVFDMRSFYKQLPMSTEQPTQERKRMLGVLSAAEKRRSFHF